VLKFALLGHPVAHSRSPEMLAAALTTLGVPGVYVPCDVTPGDLGKAVHGLLALGFRGANVTLPHKVAALTLVGSSSERARLAGAANVLTFQKGAVLADNTDVTGAIAALREAGCDPRGQAAVVVGSGGAARAVAVGLALAGARSVAVVARTGASAERVAAVIRKLNVAARTNPEAQRSVYREAAPRPLPSAIEARSMEWTHPDTREALAQATIIVQTTSCGMTGGPSWVPLLAHAPPSWLRPGAFAMDAVYTPQETAWLAAARAAGLVTVDGVGMLVHQGAEALRSWLAVTPPITVMRQAVEKALRGT
jgi:shikimate dehydrogenase